MVKSGDTMVPVITRYPDRWYGTFRCDKGEDTTEVSKSFFDSVKLEDWFDVTFKTGRISGGFYVYDVIQPTMGRSSTYNW